MEYNKSKWELKYESFKNGSVDKEIETLREKIKDEADKFNVAIKEGKNNEAQNAQDEINKLQGEFKKKESTKLGIKTNEAKIQNILQLKKDLVQDSAELIKKQNEINAYQKAKKTIEDNDKEVINLEAEIKGIDIQIKQLNTKINDPTVTPEDRKKFEQDKEKLKGLRQQKSVEIGKYNNEEYSKALKDKEKLEGKVGTYNIKSINTTLAKNEKLIAKCDLIGKNLVNGKSMEEISVSLKKTKITPNKDFAKKISAMRDLYEKEAKSDIVVAKQDSKKIADEVQKAYENVKAAVERGKKAEEEYKKITNLPAPKKPWYKKVPILKQIINGISKIFNKGETPVNVEEAKAKVEQALKEAEAAKKEYFDKREQAEKAKEAIVKQEKGRSTDYLAELRKQKDENTILEGMTLYGDTFKDRLKYQMPNIKTKLTQTEIDNAKSKNKYVMPGHDKDKRNYEVDARKEMVRKNIENMKSLRAKKEAQQEDDGR